MKPQKIPFYIDRKYRLPRIWSNNELIKFAHLFDGSVLNVSGFGDSDKNGNKYKAYFENAKSYEISNFKADVKGLKGQENEFYLDLESDLNRDLVSKYDVVFNHTTLEHVFQFEKAFDNICKLSNDIVIIVVPFLQQHHGNYGDYWRFTPEGMAKLFENEGVHLQYLTFNTEPNSSVYIFCIGTKKADSWLGKIPQNIMKTHTLKSRDGFENFAGSRAVSNWKFVFYSFIKRFIK